MHIALCLIVLHEENAHLLASRCLMMPVQQGTGITSALIGTGGIAFCILAAAALVAFFKKKRKLNKRKHR